jgi:hypothetical protein
MFIPSRVPISWVFYSLLFFFLPTSLSFVSWEFRKFRRWSLREECEVFEVVSKAMRCEDFCLINKGGWCGEQRPSLKILSLSFIYLGFSLYSPKVFWSNCFGTSFEYQNEPVSRTRLPSCRVRLPSSWSRLPSSWARLPRVEPDSLAVSYPESRTRQSSYPVPVSGSRTQQSSYPESRTRFSYPSIPALNCSALSCSALNCSALNWLLLALVSEA